MRAFVRGGRAAVTSDNPQLRSWRQDVAAVVAEAADGQLEGPIQVDLEFVLSRPSGHFGKRGLLPSAPRYPTGARGDLDKLCRAVLDAVTAAGAWRDDGQVVRLDAWKRYAAEAEGPHVFGAIHELES